MGSCAVCQSQNVKPVAAFKESTVSGATFPRDIKAKMSIGVPDIFTTKTTVTLRAKPPVKKEATDLDWANTKIPCDGTVLPNATATSSSEGKPCQDNFAAFASDEKVMLCLFDGHGSYSEIVVKSLTNICEAYFE
jgi:hypothetical protein